MSNSPSDKIKYFLYVRKSSEDKDRQVQSIPDQITNLLALANTNNFDIIEIISESKSAKKPYNRPAFTQMLERIKKGEANGILCWKLDRLARNPVDAGEINWLLQSSVITQIITIDRTFYPTDNVLMMSVEFGMANQFIIDLKKNSNRGMESKANDGWFPGRASIGYLNEQENRTIIPDENRFSLVRKIWDCMLTGNYTPEQVCTFAAKDWGLKTVRRKQSGDKELSLSAVYALLNNPFYYGAFLWRGKLYAGKHKPMISVAEFEMVQSILHKSSIQRPQKHIFSYTGLLRCGDCGCMYTATIKQKKLKPSRVIKEYIYYHCTRKRRRLTSCTNRPITLEELESEIELELEKFSINKVFVVWATSLIEAEMRNEDEKVSQLKKAQEQTLVDTRRELDSLIRMRLKDMIDDEIFLKERNKLSENIIRLEAQLKETKSKDARKNIAIKHIDFAFRARMIFQTGTSELKRSVLTAIGSNFCIKNQKLIFEASEVLCVVAKQYELFKGELKRLELENKPCFPINKSKFSALFHLGSP